MQVRPAQTIYLSYIIPNPGDSTTYYPQAVVRNTQSGAIIATVNLTQDSTQILRYTGSFTSPADTIGNGYFLDVITIPYTDSAHTTPSLNYGAAYNQYFVWQPPPYYGGGDAVLIDYEKIMGLFDDGIKKVKIPKQQKVKFPKFPFIPPAEKVDMGPVMRGMEDLRGSHASMRSFVEGLPERMPKASDIDLTPLRDATADHSRRMEGMMRQEAQSFRDELKKAMVPLMMSFQARMEARMGEYDRKMEGKLDEVLKSGLPISLNMGGGPKEVKKGPPKNAMRELLG